MSIWNYIGEFFLFRWLFGKLQHTENSDTPIGKSNDSHWNSSNSYDSNTYNWDNSQSYDGFHEEQDDYDMMDDF